MTCLSIVAIQGNAFYLSLSEIFNQQQYLKFYLPTKLGKPSLIPTQVRIQNLYCAKIPRYDASTLVQRAALHCDFKAELT